MIRRLLPRLSEAGRPRSTACASERGAFYRGPAAPVGTRQPESAHPVPLTLENNPLCREFAELRRSDCVGGVRLRASAGLHPDACRRSDPRHDANGRPCADYQFAHYRAFSDASNTTVVGSNVDTLYSLAQLDLSEEPFVLSVPETGNRFWIMQVVDGWNNVPTRPAHARRPQGWRVRDRRTPLARRRSHSRPPMAPSGHRVDA
jgi:hypothetical protein